MQRGDRDVGVAMTLGLAVEEHGKPARRSIESLPINVVEMVWCYP
jgi:hypothetical protein